MPPSSSAYTRRVGAGANWTSAPQPIAPRASPLVGAVLLTTPARPGEYGGLRSTRVAPSVVMAAPVAMPWMTRARSSSVMSPAVMNSASATASRVIAKARTGRLPT